MTSIRRRLLVATGLVVAALTASWALRPTPAERLAVDVGEMRAAGEPVTFEELLPAMPPDAENGAQPIDDAFAWLAEHDPENAWRERAIGSAQVEFADAAALLDARVLVDELAPLFERIDRAAARPAIAWALGPHDTAATAMVELVASDRLAVIGDLLHTRLLVARRADERIASILGSLRVGWRVRTARSFEASSAVELHAQGSALLRARLEQGDADLAAARSALDEALDVAWTERFADAVRGDRVQAVAVLPFVFDGSWHEHQAAWLARLGINPPTAFERLEDAFKAMASGRAPPAYGDDDPDGSQLIEAARGVGWFVAAGRSAREIWDEEGSPDREGSDWYPALMAEFVRADAAARLARLALAACEHRRAQGAWPATPSDLAPLFPDGVPADPFTGEPFELEIVEGALLLRATPWRTLPLQTTEEGLRDAGLRWRLPAE